MIVEDDAELAEAIADGLRREAIVAEVALDGDEALEKLTMNGYDVVLLDRDLRGVHGDEVCKWIVERGTGQRVLMLTAAAQAT